MNKFIIEPDRPASLAGCLFWLLAFSAGAALVWIGLLRIVKGVV